MVIEPRADGYRTRVVSSPAGEAQAGFVLPFADKDLRLLVLKAAASIDRFRRKVRRIESHERQLLEDFGGQLFEAVFTGPVGECLGRSRLTVESKDAGLRIRLRLPGTLANIPWEYLYDPRHGFVGPDPQIALVRSLELPAPLRPFPISLPLRILAMISAPSDIAGLQIEQEWAKLNGALTASRHTSCTPPAKEEPQPPPDRQLAFSKWLKPTPRSLPSAEGPNRRCCRRSPHQ